MVWKSGFAMLGTHFDIYLLKPILKNFVIGQFGEDLLCEVTIYYDLVLWT